MLLMDCEGRQHHLLGKTRLPLSYAGLTLNDFTVTDKCPVLE